ncbi:hypothetical protein M422DRAFT_782533 [Sphaerobolus stellatus SS14]|uniref:DUF6533 domain-containing protein n=1 Tax=Sphaerobolus stellatus (strain SS14) TaxID=990650 RepID=A0A0C9UKW8_SPHS4|nr:hypothetical protein M422DRAFT_782533 [Sphaerobolus stellatus SS14]
MGIISIQCRQMELYSNQRSFPSHNMSSDPFTSILQQLIDQGIGPLAQLRVANYATVAAFTVLIYDIVLSLSKEVEYIWRTEWSIIKVLYIIARYVGTIVIGVPSIFVAALFFCLTVYKFYGNAIASGEFSGVGWKNLSPVFRALIRDGTVTFFLITAVLIFAVVFFTTVHSALLDLQPPYLTGTLSMAGSHLVLNLREAAAHGRLPTSVSPTESKANTAVQFQMNEISTLSGAETGIETTTPYQPI